MVAWWVSDQGNDLRVRSAIALISHEHSQHGQQNRTELQYHEHEHTTTNGSSNFILQPICTAYPHPPIPS